MTDDKLLKQQHDLQLEAEEIVEELKLDDLLTTAGKPVRVGSSALDDQVRTPNQFDEWMEKMNHRSL